MQLQNFEEKTMPDNIEGTKQNRVEDECYNERIVICGYCKDCYWRDNGRYCSNENAIDENYGQGRGYNDDRLIYSYQEGGAFEVGDKFGCVHFKSKNT